MLRTAFSLEDAVHTGVHVRIGQMSVYEERKDELERYEFMMGRERGRLAITLDCITDAMVLVGQHGVYCQSARQIGKPAMDIQLITKSLTDAKELISSVLEMKSPGTVGGKG
jgi:hypothetical protein